MTVHSDQIESVLKRSVQAVLSRGLNDPRVRGMISVTGVSVSPDLAHAKVMISVLPEAHQELTMHGLRNAAAHIRSEVGRTVRMRRVPELAFRADQGLKRMAEIDAALDAVRREDRPETAQSDADSPEEPKS